MPRSALPQPGFQIFQKYSINRRAAQLDPLCPRLKAKAQPLRDLGGHPFLRVYSVPCAPDLRPAFWRLM